MPLLLGLPRQFLHHEVVDRGQWNLSLRFFQSFFVNMNGESYRLKESNLMCKKQLPMIYSVTFLRNYSFFHFFFLTLQS